eukprot:2429557-Amphidinium_carterae.1
MWTNYENCPSRESGKAVSDHTFTETRGTAVSRVSWGIFMGAPSDSTSDLLGVKPLSIGFGFCVRDGLWLKLSKPILKTLERSLQQRT